MPTTPILILPDELLASVLLSTFDSTNPATSLRLRNLSSVCAAWWRVIKATGIFWRYIDVGSPTMNLHLSKSKQCGLDIAIGREVDDSHDSLLREAHRWRWVDHQGPSPSHAFLRVLSRELPMLESLKIRSSRSLSTTGEQYELAGGPKLRFFDATGPVAFNPSGFSTLVDLNLHWVQGHLIPATIRLIQLVSGQLEGLQISTSARQFRAKDLPGFAEPVVFPRLRFLHIGEMRAAWTLTCLALHSFRTPVLQKFKFTLEPHDMEEDDSVPEWLMEKLFYPPSKDCPLVSVLNGRPFAVSLHNHRDNDIGVLFWGTLDAPKFVSELQSHMMLLSPPEVLGTAFKNLTGRKGPSPLAVALKVWRPGPDFSDLRHTLQFFRGATHVEIHDPKRGFLIPSLSLLSEGDESPSSWLCPSMGELTITDKESFRWESLVPESDRERAAIVDPLVENLIQRRKRFLGQPLVVPYVPVYRAELEGVTQG